MLTPCHIHRSRLAGLQRRSPRRSYHHFGCTACRISPQPPRRPVENQTGKYCFYVPPRRLHSVLLSSYFFMRHTQHDPQEPWSLICWIVTQLGHCWRASKLSGRLMPSILWTLNKRRGQNHCRWAGPADCHLWHVTSCANHLINLHLWQPGPLQYGATQLSDIAGINILEILRGLEQKKRRFE